MSACTKRPDPLETALCGILLHPAGHTRSPAMHRAAYEALGLNAHYQAFDVPADRLGAAVTGVRSLGLRQVAVSIPHKEAMIGLVEEVEEVAARIGAINTVTRVGDRLVGANTDWLGAVRALEQETPIAGRRAVVLGAGGTARAVVFGLRERGAEVFVLNRTRARAETLARDLGAQGFGGLDELAALAPELIVQTTSVGLREDRSPVDRDALPKGVVALDAVYAPARTRLLADVESRGGHPVAGKWMLVHQAVEQLRLWTRALPDPPDESALARATAVMAAAFDAAAQPS